MTAENTCDLRLTRRRGSGFEGFDALVLAFWRLSARTLVAMILIGAPPGVHAEPSTTYRSIAISDTHGCASSRLRVALEPQADAIEIEVLITNLLKWIGARSENDVSHALAHPPEVYFCDRGATIQYGGREIAIPADGFLRAAYDVMQRRIYLIRPWTISDAWDRSTLLHELIHDVQYFRQVWTCEEAMEWEAYKLQDVWLAERGIQSGFNWTHVFLLSRCPSDTHP